MFDSRREDGCTFVLVVLADKVHFSAHVPLMIFGLLTSLTGLSWNN
jgi:hypothetical protein